MQLCTLRTLHKDPYDNIYAVVAGAKHFTLVPPSDHFHLREQACAPAAFRFDAAMREWQVDVEDGDDVPWIADDVDDDVDDIIGDVAALVDKDWSDENDTETSSTTKTKTKTKTKTFGGPVPRLSPGMSIPAAHCAAVTSSRALGAPATARSRFNYKLRVDVAAGEVLFLPSLWYHQVGSITHVTPLNRYFPCSRFQKLTLISSLDSCSCHRCGTTR
jgi:hypothetical protein